MRAFIILGPSNSGSRYLTRLFLSNDCWGDRADHTDGFTQRLDDDIWPNSGDIVWKTHNCRRIEDYPQDKRYGNLSVFNMVDECKERGYEPNVLMLYRDIRLNTKAQGKAGYAGTWQQLYDSLMCWYVVGFRSLRDLQLDGVNTMVVNYDLMVKHSGLYTREINDHFGLKLRPIHTIDANAKHWGPI